MEIGGIKAPAYAAYRLAASRQEPADGGTRAVPTELPKPQSVAQAAEPARPHADARPGREAAQLNREQLLRDFIRTRSYTDPRTRELVSQTVNTRTGEVIRQFPDETILRLREYVTRVIQQDAQKAGNSAENITRIA